MDFVQQRRCDLKSFAEQEVMYSHDPVRTGEINDLA